MSRQGTRKKLRKSPNQEKSSEKLLEFIDPELTLKLGGKKKSSSLRHTPMRKHSKSTNVLEDGMPMHQQLLTVDSASNSSEEERDIISDISKSDLRKAKTKLVGSGLGSFASHQLVQRTSSQDQSSDSFPR